MMGEMNDLTAKIGELSHLSLHGCMGLQENYCVRNVAW